MTSSELRSRLDVAIQAAREAGHLTLNYFQRVDLSYERKSDDSPVTVADRAAEEQLRKTILAHFPEDAVLGEEFGEVEGSSGYRWILDPIDGTKSFISGVPLYGTLIGVEHNERSVIGVILIPGLQECVYAVQGGGAWYVRGDADPTRASVSAVASLRDAVCVTTQVDSFAQRLGEPAYQGLQSQAYIMRTWGDCYGYLLVATGRAGVMIDPYMNVWDAAAIQPIMEEAGGTFTDWQGVPTIYSGEGIGTNGHLLEEVLRVTRPCPRLS